jgi:hypothetical protein
VPPAERAEDKLLRILQTFRDSFCRFPPIFVRQLFASKHLELRTNADEHGRGGEQQDCRANPHC